MTKLHSSSNGFFVISILEVTDIKKLKKVFKRFISKKLSSLQAIDTEHKMFDLNNHFIELKGSSLTKSMKIEFVEYLLKSKLFRVYIVKNDNNKLADGKIYENTARAFNYFLKLALTYYIHQGYLPKDEYLLQIDERNTKPNALYSLEDYLNIELCIADCLVESCEIRYFHSHMNTLIQIADFFSNLYYSYLHQTSSYQQIISKLRNENILIDSFIFPIK